MKTIRELIQDSRGATAIEYGLLVGVIAVGSLVTFTQFGRANATGLKASLEKISAAIEAVKKP